jgi:uncharacterized membrane protein YhdT
MRDTRKTTATPMKTLSGKDLRKLGLGGLVVLVLLDLVVTHYRYFTIDGTFGFAAWFGALSCFALIMLALAVGSLLRAPERTYDD